MAFIIINVYHGRCHGRGGNIGDKPSGHFLDSQCKEEAIGFHMIYVFSNKCV